MALVPKFTQGQIKAQIDAFIKVAEKRTIQRFQYLGEQCVILARSNGDYMDQTGNLRSSVGYVVFKDGVAVSQSFSQVGSGLKGTNEGRTTAMKVGAKNKKGISLVVVAGMNYALAVESKGRDVLTSTELFAKQQLPIMMEALRRNINSALS